jgi:hypothetical protein
MTNLQRRPAEDPQLLNRRDTPRNSGPGARSIGQPAFYKDVEANLFVIPAQLSDAHERQRSCDAVL